MGSFRGLGFKGISTVPSRGSFQGSKGFGVLRGSEDLVSRGIGKLATVLSAYGPKSLPTFFCRVPHLYVLYSIVDPKTLFHIFWALYAL